MKMKKTIALLCALLLALSLPFAAAEEAAPQESVTYEDSEIDLDLSVLSATIAYSQIANFMYDPAPFLGQIIRLRGYYDVFEDSSTGLVYYLCNIPDVSACCAQGIEFIWAGDHAWPEDYPEPGTDITVTGRLETYMEGNNMYLHLTDAEVTWAS